MPVTYADCVIVPVEGAEYISEFTWASEHGGSLVASHYFVDYPGARSLERLIVEVVGGKPLVRYSSTTVLRTFSNSIPKGHIIAFRTLKQKMLVKALFAAAEISNFKAFCTFEDVDAGYGEIDAVMHSIQEARITASQKFGNAL